MLGVHSTGLKDKCFSIPSGGGGGRRGIRTEQCTLRVTFTYIFFLIKADCMHYNSDAENSRSACFDWHNFIRTGIKYEILLQILLFGLPLFLKYLILTCLFKKISTSLLQSSCVAMGTDTQCKQYFSLSYLVKFALYISLHAMWMYCNIRFGWILRFNVNNSAYILCIMGLTVTSLFVQTIRHWQSFHISHRNAFKKKHQQIQQAIISKLFVMLCIGFICYLHFIHF